MKNLPYLIAGIAVLGLMVALVIVYGTDGTDNSKRNNQEVQKIVLSMKDGNYYPNTINVKAETPVRISLDNSVGGCYRSFTIRQLGISKYLKGENDYVEFTPNAGTYKFACSMSMGSGTLVVT